MGNQLDILATEATDMQLVESEEVKNTGLSFMEDERGMATAEYAVGTVATVSFVGIIIGILQNPEFQKLIWEIIKAIAKIITGLVTGGL